MEKRREQPTFRDAKNECFDEANEETQYPCGDDDVFRFFFIFFFFVVVVVVVVV
jgi:hypothetical protein